MKNDAEPVLFLPGIIMPAALRYAPLLTHLPDVRACVTELAVYAEDAPPRDYSVDSEIANIAESADRAGFDRFHIYGHSAGGACALAFAARYPERVRSLALDEPGTDHTAADHADPYWREILALRDMPPAEASATFMRLQVAPGVELPPPPEGAAPPWMARRPAGARACIDAFEHFEVDPEKYRRLRVPVLFTHGSLSHPRWRVMRDRLATMFPDFRDEPFEGLHHHNTSHMAEPARTAALLTTHWARG